MIKVIHAKDRHFNDFGWLKTYWLFSFDQYYDPNNLNFGSIRVFNDDVVGPGQGFPTHAHAEMEIITIVLSGAVTHTDSMGNKGKIRAGDIQRMSAGTGVRHSEFNFESDPLHLYQIWIMPDKKGQTPSYEQRTINVADFKNRILPVASSAPVDGVIHLNTEGSIYLSDLDAGSTLTHPNPSRGRLFLYVTSGKLAINGVGLNENDQARIEGEESLAIKAETRARFMLIAVP